MTSDTYRRKWMPWISRPARVSTPDRPDSIDEATNLWHAVRRNRHYVNRTKSNSFGSGMVIMISFGMALGSVFAFWLYFKMAWNDPYGEWVGKIGPYFLFVSIGLMAVRRRASRRSCRHMDDLARLTGLAGRLGQRRM